MAASGHTKIQLYYTATSGVAPSALNLIDGELAINIADGYIYYKDNLGAVKSLSSISGSSGASGYSGFSGYSGGTGTNGTSGYSGFSGFSGAAGGAGSSGASGYSGYSGSGVSGFSGFSGYSGGGGSGSSGISGYSGFSGAAGTSGFSGYSGGTGSNGASGTSGYSGHSGFNGISGFSGTSGYSGFSGATGPSVYPGAGIALSTGSAWGTSFNNSTNPVTVNYGGTGLVAATAGYIPFGSTSTALGTSSNFFWDNSNIRLGVGITAPLATLHVKGGNGGNVIVDNDGSRFTTQTFANSGTAKAQMYWDQTNTLFMAGTDVAAPFVFKTNAAEGMRLSSGGGLSVGVSTSTAAGNVLISGGYKTTNFTIIEESGVLNFYNGATKIMSLNSTGNLILLANVTAYGTP